MGMHFLMDKDKSLRKKICRKNEMGFSDNLIRGFNKYTK